MQRCKQMLTRVNTSSNMMNDCGFHIQVCDPWFVLRIVDVTYMTLLPYLQMFCHWLYVCVLWGLVLQHALVWLPLSALSKCMPWCARFMSFVCVTEWLGARKHVFKLILVWLADASGSKCECNKNSTSKSHFSEFFPNHFDLIFCHLPIHSFAHLHYHRAPKMNFVQNGRTSTTTTRRRAAYSNRIAIVTYIP